MRWAFQRVQEFLDSVIARSQPSAEWIRSDHEPFLLLGFSRGGEAEAEEMVDGSFEGFAGAPGFVLDQAGHVVIEGEGSAHIMMLGLKAS